MKIFIEDGYVKVYSDDGGFRHDLGKIQPKSNNEQLIRLIHRAIKGNYILDSLNGNT